MSDQITVVVAALTAIGTFIQSIDPQQLVPVVQAVANLLALSG